MWRNNAYSRRHSKELTTMKLSSRISNFIFKICLVFIISNLVLTDIARAQSAGLSISPPVVEIILSPNKKVIQAFNIKNQGESGQFVINLHAVSPDGEQGHVTLDPQPLDPSSIPILITLQNSDLTLGQPFHLAEGSSTQIVLGIEGSTTDTTLDTYFALVISSASSSAAISSSAGISSLIFTTLTPSGTLPVDLEVTGFDPPLLSDSSSELNLTVSVANQSPTMLRVQGNLTLESSTGTIQQELSLYPTLILSHSSRIMTQTYGDPPISTPLVLAPDTFRFGPYRLRLTLTTVGGSTIQELERIIWIVPLKLTIIILVLLITLAAIFAWRSRKSTLDTS